jgi:photosystem II stability/assembly factor-like uncharacterized protein
MTALRRSLTVMPLLAVLLLHLHALAARADVSGSFLPLGPDGGTITALAVDPLDPAVIYAGARDGGGVFKSTDAGANWSAMRNGIPYGLGTGVLSLAVDPRQRTTVYAGTESFGVFKSTDGGASWSPANQGLINSPGSAQVVSLAVDPRSTSTVFAGTGAGVFKSTDGGETWKRKFAVVGDTTGFSFALDTSRPQTIVYAAVGLLGVYRSNDGGETWKPANHGLPGGANALFLALSPQQPGTLYVGGAGVFKSTNGGTSWKRASNGLAGQTVNALLAHPLAPGVLWAATNAGVFRSDDGAATWKPTGLAGPVVLSLATDSHATAFFAGTDFFAGTNVFDGSAGGVYSSGDGGATWQGHRHGISALSVIALAVEPTSPPVLWATTDFPGVFRSGDGGSTWTPADAAAGGKVGSVAVDLGHPGTVYALVFVIPSQQWVLKSLDSGATWSRRASPPSPVTALTVDPHTGALFATGAAGVYRSVDDRAAWQTASGEIATTEVSVLVSPEERGVVYAFGHTISISGIDSPPQARIFKSVDDGATWTRSDAGLASVFVTQLVVVPGSPSTLYALCGLGNGQLFRSRDAGASWEAVPSILDTSGPLDLAAGAGGTLFGSTAKAGVLTSSDGGATWQPLNGAPPKLSASLLRFDPVRPNRLYLGTDTIGLVAFDIAAPSVCPSGATSATALCLQGRRFQVEVAWSDFNGNTGAGQTLPGNDETGSFWFFDPNNTELVVKVLDGRLLNNHFWVFYASLTNVAYTLTVTDTATGAVRIYKNPLGHFGSAGDTEAF